MTGKDAGVCILRRVVTDERMNIGEIFHAPALGDAALERRFPEMRMGVDHARHQEHAARIDDLRIRGIELGRRPA